MIGDSQFTYRAFWSAHDEKWIGVCLEFPDLGVWETTMYRALLGIKRLVEERGD
jgi:hypothetical protein